MGRLYIPNSIYLHNFESIFKKNNLDFSDKKVNIEFHPTYVAMHPIGLAFYAAMADYFQENKIDFKAKINTNIKSIPFLQRMGFFNSMGFDNVYETKVHDETGKFIPLRKVRNSDELAKFLKSIDPLFHTDRNKTKLLKYVLDELLRNVLEHSRALYGGNVCACYNSKKKKIQIGISDSGQGLRNSLSRFHTVKDDKDAIIKALTPGISGTTKRIGGARDNAGAGLFYTKSIASNTRNYFIIYSGTALYKLKLNSSKRQLTFDGDPLWDHYTIKENLPHFNGTVLGIDIQINDEENVDLLFKMIGEAFTKSVRQQKKDFYKRIKFT